MPKKRCKVMEDSVTNEISFSFVNNEEEDSNEQNIIDVPCTSSSEEKTTQKRPSDERRKRRNAERLGVQLYDARESFGTIADKHAEAMVMLAEAMKLQAEATLQISNAIERMAKNEERNQNLNFRRQASYTFL